MSVLDKLKKVIDERKQEIKNKEKILREREKRSGQKKLIEFGRLIMQTKLDGIEEKALLGALYEIADKSTDASNLKKWVEYSNRQSPSTNTTRLTISFKNPPSAEDKNFLKGLGLRWNSFRGEYYGYCDKKKLENAFKKCECKIEVHS